MQETDVNRNDGKNSFVFERLGLGGQKDKKHTEKTIHKCVSKGCAAEKEDKERDQK